METNASIPVFTLFGETGHFPDVVHCERFSARAPIHGWHISAHRHAQMAQLFLIDSGRMDARIDGNKHSFGDASFLYLPAQTVHEFHFLPDTSGQVISLPLNVISSIGPTSQDVVSALAKPVFGASSKALGALTTMLASATSDATLFRAQRAVGLAHSVLGLVAEMALETATSNSGLTRSRLLELDRLIAEQMSKSWTASDYAEALAMSTGHLSRLCRSASGMGATAYIEQIVMEEACRMLAFTQLPISEIGYRLGFSDPSYFSKRFRVTRHQTPSDYRAQFVA